MPTSFAELHLSHRETLRSSGQMPQLQQTHSKHTHTHTHSSHSELRITLTFYFSIMTHKYPEADLFT